jgi:hypothetical protein
MQKKQSPLTRWATAALLLTACGDKSSNSPGDSTGGGADDSGTATTPPATTAVTSGGDADLGEDAQDGCSTTCCRDDITFTVEDGRTDFTLTFDAQSATVVCPAGTADDPSWSVTCNGASVDVDAEGTAFSSSATETVRLDGGPPQSFGEELTFVSCDCNCLPLRGQITVLVDGGSGATGETGSTTAGETSSSTGG